MMKNRFFWILIYFIVFALIIISGCSSKVTNKNNPFENKFKNFVFVPEKDGEHITRIESKSSKKIYPEVEDIKKIEKPYADRSNEKIVKRFYAKDLPLRIVTDILGEITGSNFSVYENISDKKININLTNAELSKVFFTISKTHKIKAINENGFTVLMDESDYSDFIVFDKKEKIYTFFMKYSNAFDVASLIGTVLGEDVVIEEAGTQEVYGHLEPDSKSSSASNTSSFADEISSEDMKKLIASVSEKNQDIAETAKKAGIVLPALITVFKKNNCIVVKASDFETIDKIRAIVENLDTPVKQVILAVKILKLSLGDGFNSFFSMNYTGEKLIGKNPSSSEGLGFMNVMGIGENTMNYIYSNAHLNAVLELYAKDDRIEIISTPFLMGADNAEIEFFSGVETPLRNDVSTKTIEIGDSGKTMTIFEVDVEKEEIGTDIKIKSFINADNTITMNIETDIATVQRAVTEIGLINDTTGEVTNFELDGKDKSEFTSTVTIPSMHTVALGGIISNEKTDYEKKVPILGDIPVLGFFFKRIEKIDVKKETIILLTPYVIDEPFKGSEVTDRFMRDNSHN
ncbi:MAG: hypothetical protein RBR08_00645 [Desulforegulaceae bacterium]|nr:hypothetical protein [Desulforegulaceae bacterium]